MARPRMLDDAVTVTLTLPRQQKDALASKAAEAGVSMSTLARWAFAQYLNEANTENQNGTHSSEL